MNTLKVTDDLVIEIWPGSEADRPLLKLRSHAQGHDGETRPGAVVVWPEEIRPLVAALAEAAGLLAEEVAV